LQFDHVGSAYERILIAPEMKRPPCAAVSPKSDQGFERAAAKAAELFFDMRYATKPRPPKPLSSIDQVDAGGGSVPKVCR